MHGGSHYCRLLEEGVKMQTHFPKNQQVAPDQNQDTSIFLLQTIKRPGIESLLDYMLESDYFIAPASTRFHNSFPGGLCLHSLNLVHAFNAANKQLLNPLPLDSVVICGLLHDLCKVNAYLRQIRVTSPQRTSKVMLPCHSQG